MKNDPTQGRIIQVPERGVAPEIDQTEFPYPSQPEMELRLEAFGIVAPVPILETD